MTFHENITDQMLRAMIRKGLITLGGNKKLQIFGRLDCKSGMRMKRLNRVFFATESEAVEAGYRPCRHCLPRSNSKKRVEK